MSPTLLQPEQQRRPTGAFQPLAPKVEALTERSSQLSNTVAERHAQFGNAAVADALTDGDSGLTPESLAPLESGLGNSAMAQAAQRSRPNAESRPPARGTDVLLARKAPEPIWKSPAETVSQPTAVEPPFAAPTLLETRPNAAATTATTRRVYGLTPYDTAPDTKEESSETSVARTKSPGPAGAAEVDTIDAPASKTSEVKGKGVKRADEPEATAREKSTGGPVKGKNESGDAETATAAIVAPSPREAIAPAISAVRNRAAGAGKHRPANEPVASAQAAAKNPKTEQARGAAAKTVEQLDSAKEVAGEVKREEFKAKLKLAIKNSTPEPKSESEASRVMMTGATDASHVLRGELTTEREAAVGPLKSAANSDVSPATQQAPPETKLQVEPVGPPAAPVSAASVVPTALPSERLDYTSDRSQTDQVMAENDVSNEQLEQGNDPAFGPAIDARASAETHEATTEARYRQSESQVQDKATGEAQEALAQGLTGMHGARALQIGQVAGQQIGTVGKDAAERQRITDKISTIKNTTKANVGSILAEMETQATQLFEDGLKRAEKAYAEAFDEAKGGVGTWLTTWGSAWDEHITEALATARRKYLAEVDKAIDDVADCVDAKLKLAKQCVADGRTQVEEFVRGLEDNVRQFGEEALQAVTTEFDAMSTEIDQRRDGLINKLTEQYKASYDRMSAMEEKLRSENKSLWQRVYDATVGIIKKIIEFKDMLLGVLGTAASVIGDIIRHPIQFLGYLVSGVMSGLENFVGKLDVYLQKGLMDWLFGALGGTGLKLPEKFGLQGMISIVLQVLGLTYANFRARAVAIVGEDVVAGLEKTAEVFKVLITEGISGLWQFIKDMLADLKSLVIDGIMDFIMERVIKAGISWIIGLLNPASAFFKACKAIYDIVTFFINRGSQILTLVNAVINSIAAIAKGAIGTAATMVENALATAIPVAIGFLASLLGLGDPTKPVRSLIDKAQAPLNKAIDWVINLALKGLNVAANFAKGLFGNKKKEEHSAEIPKEEDPQKAVKIEAGLLDIDKVEQPYVNDGRIKYEDAVKVALKIKSDHPVFKSFSVKDAGNRWDYHWEASPGKDKTGEAKAEEEISVKEKDIVVLIGIERGKKRAWPIRVVTVDPGKNFTFEGYSGRGFSALRGTLSFKSYKKSWRLVESNADLHIEEHHKIPWEHKKHVTHELTVLSAIDLFGDPRNRMMLGGHRSRHSGSYHASITDMLNASYGALQDKTPDAANEAIGRIMAEIESQIVKGDLRLYSDRDVWIP